LYDLKKGRKMRKIIVGLFDRKNGKRNKKRN